MKKMLNIFFILALASCSLSPDNSNKEMARPHPTIAEADTTYVESRVISDDESIIIEIPNEPVDTTETNDTAITPEIDTTKSDTSKRTSKRERREMIQQTYEVQNKNVLKQIDKLEQQRVQIDSILQKKKDDR